MSPKNTKGTKKVHTKRRFQKTRLFKILRILLLVLIIAIIINIVSDINHKSPSSISLVIGDSKIELKNPIIIDEKNNIYLSKDDIANLYDKNIYYNNSDGTIITTYNKHIAKLEKSKTTMSINDTVTEIRGMLKEENGILYLPFSDMGMVYDFEYKYNKNSKILMVDSISESKSEAIVLKNAKLKETTKNFAKTIQKVKKTEYVTVLGTEGKFTKVRTSLGNIGFIKTDKLSNSELKREAMKNEKIENLQLLNDYDVVKNYEVLSEKSDNVQVVAPKLLNINEEFNIETVIDLSGERFKAYKNWAEQSNVTIAAVTTFSGSMNKLCSEYDKRTYVINSLYTELIKNRITMICLDFDNIDDVEGFYRFITEMVPRFKEAGIEVTVKYKDTLNKDRLNSIVDYIF